MIFVFCKKGKVGQLYNYKVFNTSCTMDLINDHSAEFSIKKTIIHMYIFSSVVQCYFYSLIIIWHGQWVTERVKRVA